MTEKELSDLGGVRVRITIGSFFLRGEVVAAHPPKRPYINSGELMIMADEIISYDPDKKEMAVME